MSLLWPACLIQLLWTKHFVWIVLSMILGNYLSDYQIIWYDDLPSICVAKRRDFYRPFSGIDHSLTSYFFRFHWPGWGLWGYEITDQAYSSLLVSCLLKGMWCPFLSASSTPPLEINSLKMCLCDVILNYNVWLELTCLSVSLYYHCSNMYLEKVNANRKGRQFQTRQVN